MRWLCVVLAILLSGPSLFASFYCDDALFIARLEGALPSPKPGALSLYTFAAGGPENQSPFWWTAPTMRLSFLRPIASALFAFDHFLFGRNALPYHLHSLAWFVATVLFAREFFRRVLSERTGTLAALLFAVTPTHATVVAWPAARHVSEASALALVALWLHIRDRERGRAPLFGLLGMGVGLLTSEIALGGFAYVFAYELFGRASSRKEKLLSLLPYGAMVAIYLVAHRALGYGAIDSGDYASPLESPWAFIANIPRHLGPLAVANFFGLASESSVAFPQLVLPMILIGALATGLFVLLLRRAARRANPHDTSALRWLLPGAFLALIPGLGGIVGDRALFLPSLGLAAAMAIALLEGPTVEGSEPKPHAARALAAVFAVFQLILGPLLFLGQGLMFTKSSRAAKEVVARADLIQKNPDTRLFGIGVADPLIGMYLEPMLVLSGSPARSVNMLTASFHDHVVHRIDERTIEVELLGGAMMENGFETVSRPRSMPLRAGDVVRLEAATVRVVHDIDGAPSRFAVTFDASAEDPRIALIAWKDGKLQRFAPPAIGTSISLKHEVGPVGF